MLHGRHRAMWVGFTRFLKKYKSDIRARSELATPWVSIWAYKIFLKNISLSSEPEASQCHILRFDLGLQEFPLKNHFSLIG